MRYFSWWTMDLSKVPVDLKERAALWEPMLRSIKQNVDEGRLLDWGCNAGELKGYSVSESDDPARMTGVLQPYMPYVIFDVKLVITIDQMLQVNENMKK